MSNLSKLRVYVGDSDGYMSINFDAYDEEEGNAEGQIIDNLSCIEVMAGKSIIRRYSDAEWEFEVYRAKRYFQRQITWPELEPRLVRKLLSIGRPYAIRRYAKAEGIPFSAAMTAALPYGMHALLLQFLTEVRLTVSDSNLQKLSDAWKSIKNMEKLTAYGKTGLIRNEIYNLAEEFWGVIGPASLPSEETREILSLTRLHFSIFEMNKGRFFRFSELKELYELEQNRYLEEDSVQGRWGVRNWRMRHLRPLIYYYPIYFRSSVERGISESNIGSGNLILERAVNELALAYCAMNTIGNYRNG